MRADQNFAVAIRDRTDLFLWLRIRRGPQGDVYVIHPTGRTDREYKKWNPHESHHRDGRVHHKSFDKKLLAKQSQKPDLDYKGTENLITRPIARGEPRAFGVLCNKGDFYQTMEVQGSTLSSKKYETYVSVDLTEPGGQPLLIPGAKITAQQIFDDSIPYIVVTFYDWHP